MKCKFPKTKEYEYNICFKIRDNKSLNFEQLSLKDEQMPSKYNQYPYYWILLEANISKYSSLDGQASSSQSRSQYTSITEIVCFRCKTAVWRWPYLLCPNVE